jgi:hypothetical protein
MAAAINVAVSWGDVTEIPVCERMCVCGRGFIVCCSFAEDDFIIKQASATPLLNFIFMQYLN